MFLTLVSLILVLVTGYLIKITTKPRRYPPGPAWYPFIGCSNIVQSMAKQHGSQWKGMSELAKEYSTQVLGLKLGSELIIAVYGEKNCREVFTNSEFEGRPDNFFTRLRCFGKRMGITFTDGLLWKEHRQFTVKHLRNVGFGKTVMEREIQNEMINVIDYLKRNSNKPVNPKSILSITVMNTLWKYVAGEKIREERLKYLLDLLNARSKAFTMTGGWLNQLPWCRFLFPELSGYSLIRKMNKQISDILDEAIAKHKNNLIEGDDFIYSFLKEATNNSVIYTDDHLKAILLDLLIAGSQTTSNVLEFALLVIIRNPIVQTKVFEEINAVLGNDTPCWNDSYRLTYTSAFLQEVQRLYTIAPFAGPRRVLNDCVLDGYTIPKETTVLISVGGIHLDPEIWNDPHEFRPERFIDESGALKNAEHMYPFGLGRRRCPGDSLARSYIFIIFVGIVQKFQVSCSGNELPSEEPSIGILSSPKPYTAVFRPRQSV